MDPETTGYGNRLEATSDDIALHNAMRSQSTMTDADRKRLKDESEAWITAGCPPEARGIGSQIARSVTEALGKEKLEGKAN